MAKTTGSTRGQCLVLMAAFLGWMFDGLEMGIFPLVARPALQDMMAGQIDASIGDISRQSSPFSTWP